MGHRRRAAFLLALMLGAISDPRVANAQSAVCHLTSALSQHLCSELSSVCLNPCCSALEGKTEEQDPAQICCSPNPLTIWNGGADFSPSQVVLEGQVHLAKGRPTHSSGHLGQACSPSGKPEPRAEGLAAVSPAQIRVFPQGSDLYTKVNCWQFLEAFKIYNFCF